MGWSAVEGQSINRAQLCPYVRIGSRIAEEYCAMGVVKFKQIEYHQVHLYKDMAVDEEDIVREGLTVERFKEIMKGEDHTDEESDIYHEILFGWAEVQDSEEDWFSDRKGGYDIDYEIIEEDDE